MNIRRPLCWLVTTTLLALVAMECVGQQAPPPPFRMEPRPRRIQIPTVGTPLVVEHDGGAVFLSLYNPGGPGMTYAREAGRYSITTTSLDPAFAFLQGERTAHAELVKAETERLFAQLERRTPPPQVIVQQVPVPQPVVVERPVVRPVREAVLDPRRLPDGVAIQSWIIHGRKFRDQFNRIWEWDAAWGWVDPPR